MFSSPLDRSPGLENCSLGAWTRSLGALTQSVGAWAWSLGTWARSLKAWSGPREFKIASSQVEWSPLMLYLIIFVYLYPKLYILISG